MLVITDEVTTGIRRQRRFARTGEAEKLGGVADFANIGGTVHRHYVLFWQ